MSAGTSTRQVIPPVAADPLAAGHGALAIARVPATLRISLADPATSQAMHARATPTLDAVMIRCSDLDVSAQTQVAPPHDLLSCGHHLLDARLFAS